MKGSKAFTESADLSLKVISGMQVVIHTNRKNLMHWAQAANPADRNVNTWCVECCSWYYTVDAKIRKELEAS